MKGQAGAHRTHTASHHTAPTPRAISGPERNTYPLVDSRPSKCYVHDTTGRQPAIVSGYLWAYHREIWSNGSCPDRSRKCFRFNLIDQQGLGVRDTVFRVLHAATVDGYDKRSGT